MALVLFLGASGRASDFGPSSDENPPETPASGSEPGPPLFDQVDNVPWRRETEAPLAGSPEDPSGHENLVVVPPPDRPPDGDVDFFDVDKGYWSYYRYGDDAFGGGCLAIRDAQIWQQFWSVHKLGVWPEPPAPEVDFSTTLVIACIQGFWRDCCTAHVEIVGVRSEGGSYRVSVQRYEWHGLMFAVTNPYHIATVPRTDGAVRFFDDYAGQPIPDLPPVP